MSTQPILPGSTIGILGSGQLGRMLAIAARRMGYRVSTLSPDQDSPTGQISDSEWVAQYDDLEAIRRFARTVDVLTFEFENVSSDAIKEAEAIVPVRPSGHVLQITQNRLREKKFLEDSGFPVTPFRSVRNIDDLRQAIEELRLPAICKTAGFGYDGKGQTFIQNADRLDSLFENAPSDEMILEAFVDFEMEISVVAARGLSGEFVHYGAVENIHKNHILDITIAPARISNELAARAVAITRNILEALQVVGAMCVEMFVTRTGDLLVNELAPRPHNSGHYTVDACITSQFEQQLRAVCGLPLGATTQLRPAAMVNLLGDIWGSGRPHWDAALQNPDVKLHLYGKSVPRPGRKMGHITALADLCDEALATAIVARDALWPNRA